MHAAQWHGREDVRIDDVTEPTMEADEVRIDVAVGGICGTDLHEYTDGPAFVPAPDSPHPLTGVTPPVTLGHEFSGVISEVGADVEGFAVGDPVTVNPAVVCNECRYCNEGAHNLCTDVANVGLATKSGGFAESAVVPAANAVKLPEDIPVEVGALVEPYAVGLHAVRRSAVRPGDTVAVFGCGPIGLTIIDVLGTTGVEEVIVSEPRAGRRERAEGLGADVTYDPTAVDAVEEIVASTNGGVDVAFEAAGIEPTYRAAIESTKHGGQILTVGISEHPVGILPRDVTVRERSIVGSNGYASGPRAGEEFGMVASMFSEGRLEPESLVTSRIDLEDIVEGGFEALLSDESDEVKVLVRP